MKKFYLNLLLVLFVAVTANAQTAAESLKLGNEQFRRNELDAAIASYSECLRLNPNEANCYSNRAAALLQKSKVVPRSQRKYVKYQSAEILETSLKALEDANKAIQLDSKNARFYFSRALIYSAEYFYQEAMSDFRQGLALEPNNAFAKKELAAAEKGYAGNLAVDAAGKREQARLAKLPGERDKFLREAVDLLTKSLELDKTNILNRVKRGEVYQEMKAYDQAVSDYSEALKMDPDYISNVSLIRAIINRAEVYGDQKKTDLALAELEKVIAIPAEKPTAFMSGDALLARGKIFLAAGQNDTAIASFDKIIADKKAHYTAYFYRGLAHLKKNNKQQAIADFRYTLSVDPNHQEAKASLQKLGVKP